MASSKISVAALFVMCMVALATFQVPQAEATFEYAACLKDCITQCTDGGLLPYTRCEMSCDSGCTQKAFTAALDVKIPA